MRTIFMVEASGDVADLSNDEDQDSDQDKIDPEGNNNDLAAAAAFEPDRTDHGQEPDQDRLDGLTDVNSEPGFAEGDVIAALHWGAQENELAQEPLGYDDNDMDDFNTGTTGPTVTQTDINPDNSYSGSKHLSQWTGSLPGLTSAIQNALSDDLRNPEYRGDPNPLTGHCYVASEAAYHLLGGREAGWKPKFFSQGRHWWLENEDGRHLDITAGQFADPYPYENGKGKGFLTAQPSKRAQVVIDRVQGRTATKRLASGLVVASWQDVQAKAHRIYKEGGIRIISVTGLYVTAHVQGDDAVYETTLQRGKSGSIDQWTCSCPWFAYSFGRSGRWKRYEGRMCSHALALQYQAQSEGMFGRNIHEEPSAPGWDTGDIRYYEAPPPKEWRASVQPTPATRVATRLYGAEEPRDDDGRWTSGMGEVTPKGYGKITPGEARGDSKRVTPQEFDDLADKARRSTTASWPTSARRPPSMTMRSGLLSARAPTTPPRRSGVGRPSIRRLVGQSSARRASPSKCVPPARSSYRFPQDADEDTFNAMMDRAKEEYADKLKGSEVYLGVFRDDKNNRIDFDPVTIVDTEEEVDALGAYTHAVGGAYDFSTGNGHFPPHVASLSSDIKEAVNVWSTIKVNNQKALPNPEHDGFRYAFHQILGDVGSYRYNASNPLFLKGEHEATVFLKAFMENQVPSHRPLYRAIGLHPDAYMAMLTSCQSGSVDLPPASWSANKSLTEQFGLTYAQETKSYEERIIFVTRPGSSSWALGRASNTGYEREHIVGGRFHVVSIKFPPESDNTTVITLQETENWPEDFGATGDLIDHMAFDSAIVSPQDAGKTARYLTVDEARAIGRGEVVPGDLHLAVDGVPLRDWVHAADDHEDPHKGTMIAVRPPMSCAANWLLDDDDAEDYDQLHVTLAYIPSEEDVDLDLLREVVESQARLSPYISATLSGRGVFENPEGNVSVVLVDSDELQVARALLVAALDRAGIEISRLHGFTPHITLKYGDIEDADELDSQPFLFTEFIISPPSDKWEHFALATTFPHRSARARDRRSGEPDPADRECYPLVDERTGHEPGRPIK